MDAVALKAAEPARWSIVFHRQAENRIFGLIAMGRFKHVSAFAWLPGPRVWVHYDLGFCRTRIIVLPDTAESKAYLAALIAGNAIVTMKARGDARPFMRLGLFCTSAVKHLIGLQGFGLRPDALYRLMVSRGGEASDDIAVVRPLPRGALREFRLRRSCLRHGGELSDDAGQDHPAADRPDAGTGTAAGPARPNLDTANAG